MLDSLDDRGVEFDLVQYLKTPLTAEELLEVMAKLPDDPSELVRKDKHFGELGLDEANFTTAAAVADLLVEHPRLMQRPIAVRGDKAVIGRPPAEIEELL